MHQFDQVFLCHDIIAFSIQDHTLFNLLKKSKYWRKALRNAKRFVIPLPVKMNYSIEAANPIQIL
jgi:hypothetical protein